MSSAGRSRDFGFGEDEEMVRDAARRFLAERLPIETLRVLVAEDHEAVYDRGEATRWDAAMWKEIVELGWTGLAVPEALGGAEFKTVGIAALVEEVGRSALPSPLVASLVATHVLRECDGAEAWLERVAAGLPLSLAATDAEGSWDSGACDVTAIDGERDLVLNGSAYFVQDAFKAEALVVLARQGDRSVICVVPCSGEGVSLSRDQIHDLTRDQATVHFEDVRVSSADIVSREGRTAIERAWPKVLVTIAADLCGSSEWQLQATVEYAKTRKQFDHPLGFFQAVKHPLVNAMVEIDRARSLLYHAACCADEGSDNPLEALEMARMAKSAASDAGAFISDRSVQLHGGIGFTWECDIHIYFKRSLHNQVLYGDGAHQRRLLADSLIGPIGES